MSTYRNDLIGPLTVLQQSLSTLDKQVRDSEALICALAVELEEVVDDVRCAKENSDLAATIPSENAFELEAKLLGLLKDLKGWGFFYGSSQTYPNNREHQTSAL
jgi:hypothetical protein